MGCRFHEGIENRLQVKGRAADGLEHLACRGLIGQGLGEFVGAGLNLPIETSELLGRLINIRGQHSKLVPVGDGHLLCKVAGGNLPKMSFDRLNWPDQRPRDDVPKAKRQQDTGDGERNNNHSGGHVGPLRCIDGVNHVGLGQIDELVRQTFEAVGQWDDLCLNVARLVRPTGPNEVDDACHLSRELIVVLPNLA